MWASMNGNEATNGAAAAGSSSSGSSGAAVSAPFSFAALAAPVQTFKFNFSAPEGDEADEDMGGEGGADSSSTAAAAAAAPTAVLQRQAVQHHAPSEPLQPPTADEVELLTLHPSSTFTVSPLDDRAAASGAVAAATAAAAAASSSFSSAAAPLQFLKRRSLGAHTALKDMLHDSDLITQVYEGGFKVRTKEQPAAPLVAAPLVVPAPAWFRCSFSFSACSSLLRVIPQVWECAIDLLLFLQRHGSGPSATCPVPLFPQGYSGTRVAELGCGHGFPGLYLLQRGCGYLALQDYNSEVIETATIDNARLNARPYSSAAGQASPASAAAAAPMAPEELDRRVGFFSGDWSDPQLLGMMGRGSYDLILTSDTLYSVAYMLPLFRSCSALLAPGGSALVAAKRYYFGIGGSTMEFADLVKREGRGEWSCTLVDTIEDGKSNIREILLLKRTPQAEAAARAAAAAAANSQMQ